MPAVSRAHSVVIVATSGGERSHEPHWSAIVDPTSNCNTVQFEGIAAQACRSGHVNACFRWAHDQKESAGNCAGRITWRTVVMPRPTSNSRLAVGIDEDLSARGTRGLHVMLVSAEAIGDVPVIEWSRCGDALATSHILCICGGSGTCISSHNRAGGCANPGCDILAAAAANLVAEDAPNDASYDCAGDIDAARASIYDPALHPAALLRWPHNGSYGDNGSLVKGLALLAPVVIIGRRGRSSEALGFVGLMLRLRRSDLCCVGLSLTDVGLDARIARGALRRECRLIATKARHVLRRRGTLTGK